MLACFVIGAAGTVIGTAAAAAVVPLGLGSDGWKIASALAAHHIGGAVNYVAVSLLPLHLLWVVQSAAFHEAFVLAGAGWDIHVRKI